MKWTKSKGRELRGLVRRRRAEAEMWRGMRGKEIELDEPKPRGDEVEGTKPKSPVKDLEGWGRHLERLGNGKVGNGKGGNGKEQSSKRC
jgi:hypothetical protein